MLPPTTPPLKTIGLPALGAFCGICNIGIYLYHDMYLSSVIMPTKNVIVRCAACGATWCSTARSPRCASRGCRSSNVKRLTVAEVEVAIEDLLDCLNEFDEDTYYALVKIDDEQYQKLPADFDLSKILTEAIDAGEEDEEPEEDEDEEVEDDEDEDVEESPKEKALAVVREERACKKVILALIYDEPENEEAREELEDEIAVLDRRYYALLRVGDDDTEEEES